MRSIICLALALAALTLVAEAEQQRILRRVIKSTPTATQLARVRLVTVRSPSGSAERGAVTEITSKEAIHFGQRNANETGAAPVEQVTPQAAAATKAKQPTVSSIQPKSTPTTTTTALPTTSTTADSATTTTTTTVPTTTGKPKASERQLSPSGGPRTGEVELLASAPSSWQTMTAVEAPAAALILAGTRPAASHSSDLTSSSSEESLSTGDFLRASGSNSKTNYASGESFSRARQQASKQSFFYPQQQQQQRSKTSNYQQATKTHWYQPTTPRPAPLVQEQQQYEQQSEQYVEQQQVEGAAPLGQAEPFAFDFKTQDQSGNGQYRKEESDKNGVVRGSYGYTDANGIYRHVEYVADQNGFRANIKSNEPGLIGETQPASIRLDGGSAPAGASQRFSASSSAASSNDEWSSATSKSESADLAAASPDFESSHKPELLRSARHFRN